jgi:subtilisin family serine protease
LRRRALAILFALVVAVGFAAAATASLLTAEQPYLPAIDAPVEFGRLAPVTVAVLDSGIDGAHPDLAGQIVGSRSFDGGDPRYPNVPHGTAVAGLIGALRGNGIGIDGIAPNARLLAVDISSQRDTASFDLDRVDAAIRWAVDRGARVLNLSLGGYVPAATLQDAVEYATRNGALVVAAGGNCFAERSQRCASPPGEIGAPAWLPHVLGVGALDAGANAPAGFSLPSARWVDLYAPGELISTLWPTRNNPLYPTPDCAYAGTTGCYSAGTTPDRSWGPSGTSYAAPMVSAAAAILFGADPVLTPAQVMRLLEETARPLESPSPRHADQAPRVLDVAAALRRVRAGDVPPSDIGEPNEQPSDATPLPFRGELSATIDWFDDPVDIYRVHLRRGEHLALGTHGTAAAVVAVSLARAPARALVTSRVGRAVDVSAPRTADYIVRLTADPSTRGTYRIFLKVRPRTLSQSRS